jgi:hypothetical protein
LPYRAAAVVTRVSNRAPPTVRAAALSGVLLGSIAVPGVIYAMATLQFDGIAVSLVPSLACAVAVWVSGWLLVARAGVAIDVARTTALATLASHLALLVLASLHMAAAQFGWSERTSLAYVVLACSFSCVAVPQALLLRSAVRRHERAFADA